MINLAVIGAGRMANAHAETLKNRPDCQFIGVYDIVPEAARTFAKKYGVEKIYPDSSQLAADSAIDAVLVCNYSDQHYRTMVELLEAGKKYIFCEKALVRNLADGEDLLKRAEAQKALVMVGHQRRYLPACARLKQLIAAGELGVVRMAKIALCHSSYDRDRTSFFADFERSGGVILDMMSHFFDQLNWYFGEPQSVSGRSLMLDRSLPQPMDYVSGTITYKNGVICNIDGSWQRYGVPYGRTEVYGDKACAICEAGDKLHVYRKGEHTELFVEPTMPQMLAFIDMIAKGTPPRTTLRDGFNSVRVALGLIEAAQQNKTILF